MNLFFVRQVRESAKTSLWILPGAAAATAVLLAKTLPIVEAAVPHGDSAWYLFPGQPDSARELLSTIASAMMTFTGLVFSITILVLQLASSQFSPRVLHAFLSDRSTRIAMASFVGTFVYSLALLPEVRGADAAGGERVPAFSVFFAFVLVLVSVGVFVRYIHRMAHSIRAVDVLRRVAEEATKCLDVLYPESPDGELPAPSMTFERPSAPPDQVVSCRRSGGVLAAVDEEALVEAARECGAIIEVVPSLGDFVVRGGPLLRVWCSARVEPDRMAAHVVIADERTAQQDPAFAFRQLVDIAIRALSPGTNDPTTAVQAINRIHDLLAALANRSFPTTCMLDASGEPRLFLTRPDWDELVHLAFDEIRHYGGESIQVVRRVRAALDDLAEICPPERRSALELQRRALDDTARSFTSSGDRARAALPSAQGQGHAPLAGRRRGALRGALRARDA